MQRQRFSGKNKRKEKKDQQVQRQLEEARVETAALTAGAEGAEAAPCAAWEAGCSNARREGNG